MLNFLRRLLCEHAYQWYGGEIINNHPVHTLVCTRCGHKIVIHDRREG